MLLHDYEGKFIVSLNDNCVYGGKNKFTVSGTDALMKLIEELIGVGYTDFSVSQLR